MSQNGNDNQPKPRAQLVITLFENGQIAVTGPVQDQILSYGMLECAKDTIAENARRMAAKAAASGIVPARAIDPMLARRQNGHPNGG